MPKYISPCAQQIVEESHGADESTLVVESDIFDDRLLPVLQGHLVNGAALCPSVSPTQADQGPQQRLPRRRSGERGV